MERVMLTMPADLLGEVDALAERTGRKRSQLVREALRELLDRERRLRFEQLLAEGYRELSAEASQTIEDAASAQNEASTSLWRWDD